MATSAVWGSEWAALLLVVIPLLFLYRSLARYRARVASRYSIAAYLARGQYARSPFHFWLRTASLLLAWCLGCFALLGQGSSPPVQQVTRRPKVDEVTFLLDVSQSMLVADTSVKRARLARAKEIIERIADGVTGRAVSLVVFAGNAVTLVPATLDVLSLRSILGTVDVNSSGDSGTNFTALFEFMGKKAAEQSFRKVSRLVLLSDGEETSSGILSPEQYVELEKKLAPFIRESVTQGARWYVVGLGSDAGGVIPDLAWEGAQVTSKRQEPFLEHLAASGSGRYYREEALPLESLTREIREQSEISATVEMVPVQGEVSGVSFWEYAYLTGAALLICAALFLPEVRRAPALSAITLLMMAALSGEARPFSLEEEIHVALQLFQAGRQDLAEEALQHILDGHLVAEERTLVIYDMASIKAKSGAFEEALTLFEELPESGKEPASTLLKNAAYNSAFCSIKLAEEAISSGKWGDAASWLAHAETHIYRARDLAYKSGSAVNSPLIHLQEIFFTLSQKQREGAFQDEVGHASPADLVTRFLGLAYQDMCAIRTLIGTDPASQGALPEYVEAFGRHSWWELQACFERLRVFDSTEIDLQVVEADIQSSLTDKNATALFSALVHLLIRLQALQASFSHQAIAEIIDGRLAAVMCEQLFPDRAHFWYEQAEERRALLLQVIQAKEARGTHTPPNFVRAFEMERLKKLALRVSRDPSTLVSCLADRRYFQVLEMGQDELFGALWEASDIPTSWMAARDRVEAYMAAEQSIGKTPSPKGDVIEKAMETVLAATSGSQDTLKETIFHAFLAIDSKKTCLFFLQRMRHGAFASKQAWRSELPWATQAMRAVGDVRIEPAAELLSVLDTSTTNWDEQLPWNMSWLLLDGAHRLLEMPIGTLTQEQYLQDLEEALSFQELLVEVLEASNNPALFAFCRRVQAEMVTALQQQVGIFSLSGDVAKIVALLFNDMIHLLSHAPPPGREVQSAREVQGHIEKILAILQQQTLNEAASQEQKSTPAPTPSRNVEQVTQEKASPEGAILMLQEMEEEDRPLELQKIPVQQGVRPW